MSAVDLEQSTFVPSPTFPQRLVIARQHAGLRQEAMANYLGLSPATLSRYETGAKAPKLQTLRLWALKCGVSFSWLVSGDANLTPEQAIASIDQRNGHSGCNAITAA